MPRSVRPNGERTIDYSALPRITFTDPQIAAVGLTDEQAKEQGIDCSCRTLELHHVPRAIVERDTRGIVKLVIERESRWRDTPRSSSHIYGRPPRG